MNTETEILILGSMPGVKSLQIKEYYAHPQNKFWDIIETCCQIPRTLEYKTRLQKLLKKKIGLWDVLQECERTGSLDSAIKGIELNDFSNFFKAFPAIRRICCNGQKAEMLFRKKILPTLDTQFEVIGLPSTSPAHARMPFEDKLLYWNKALTSLH